MHVAAFKAPTEPELAHDFLWRVHPHAPENGHISIFDRSHYEDVLIVRVHDLVPEGALAGPLRPTSATSSRCWPTRAR